MKIIEEILTLISPKCRLCTKIATRQLHNHEILKHEIVYICDECEPGKLFKVDDLPSAQIIREARKLIK